MKLEKLPLILALALAPLSTASAQDPAGEGVPEPGDGVIQLEELVVEGEIEKPNAFYILNRTRFGYEVLDMRTSFLPDVVESVQGEPF